MRQNGISHHCKMYTFQIPPRNWQVSRLGSTKTERQRIKVDPQIIDIHVITNVGVRHELNALLAEQIHATIDGLLLKLHVRDAVHEQPPDAIGALEDGDLVPHLVQLVRGGQAGRAGSHHRDGHARALLGNAGRDEALVPRVVDDRVLDVLDRHGRVDEAGDARPLARRGADAPGELREVVRLVQAKDGVAPLPVVHEVVPLGDEVVDGAAGVGLAEGGAAVHAPGGLDLALDGRVFLVVDALDGVEFPPVEHALGGVPVLLLVALVVDEPSEFFDGLVGSVAALHPATREIVRS